MAEIQYFKHDEIDKNLWDECIHHACNTQIYALSWYLDVVSPGWEALVLVRNEQYQLCFPLPVRKKLGLKYIFHPFFCQQLGLFSLEPLNQDVRNKVLNQLFIHFSYIPSLSFNVENEVSSYERKNLLKDELCTHLLALNQPYEKLHAHYRRDRKYRLKQAQKRGLKIEMSDDIAPLIRIFRDDTEHRIPGHGHNTNLLYLEKLFETVKEKGTYELYYVKDEKGEYNCGCWFVFYQNHIIFLFNAATAAARNQNGRTIIIDHVIQKYQSSDFILDFESPKKEAIRSFYASFGSKATPYTHFYYNALPDTFKKLHTLKIKVHRKLLQTLYPEKYRHLPDIHLPTGS